MNRLHHASPAPVNLAQESIAGEEDPGASLDMGVLAALPPGTSDPRAGRNMDQPSTPRSRMAPGGEPAPGTPGTSASVCPRCGGSGKLAGSVCHGCEGTGKVTVGLA